MIAALSGTTALLLLCVFSIVIARLCCGATPPRATGSVLDLGARRGGRRLFLAGRGPATGRTHPVRDRRGLLAIGIVLWLITWAHEPRGAREEDRFRDIAPRGLTAGTTYARAVTIPDLATLHALGLAQQPTYPDSAAVDSAVTRLRTMPPSVFAGECDDQGQDRRHPRRGRSCSRAATAPRPLPASPPTTSATSSASSCRWPSC